MSEARNEPPATERASPPDAPEPSPAEETVPAAPSARAPRPLAILWLAGLLVLVIGGVALSPFWAPAIAPLLPWARTPAAADYDALAARIAALEQRPPPPTVDADAVQSAEAATARRVAALETAVAALRQDRQASSQTTAAVTQLAQRIDQSDTQAASRSAAATSEIQQIQQGLAQRTAADGDLGARLATLEHRVQAQDNADHTGAIMMLALLQMREAIDEARPFPAEYATFKALAARDPDLTAAAEPLADAARDGVASRAVLRQRLADLAAGMTTAKPTATKSKWWEQALERLRGLVTIRQIDDRGKPGPGRRRTNGARARRSRRCGCGARTADRRQRRGGATLAADGAPAACRGNGADASAGIADRAPRRRPGGGTRSTPRGADAERRAGHTEDSVLMRGIFALIVIAALAAAAVFLADNPGRVEILWQGWQIDTSVGVLIAAAALAALAVALALWLLSLILGSPGAFFRRRRERRRRAGYQALTRGMVAVAAGEAQEARRYARRAEALLAEPPLTLLLSAQAAQIGGDELAAKRFFTAMLDRRETEFLGLRGLLNQALREGDRDAARRLADAGRSAAPEYRLGGVEPV